MKATIPLVARKGRASYLGERSAGHQDPGATSSYLTAQGCRRHWTSVLRLKLPRSQLTQRTQLHLDLSLERRRFNNG